MLDCKPTVKEEAPGVCHVTCGGLSAYVVRGVLSSTAGVPCIKGAQWYILGHEHQAFPTCHAAVEAFCEEARLRRHYHNQLATLQTLESSHVIGHLARCKSAGATRRIVREAKRQYRRVKEAVVDAAQRTVISPLCLATEHQSLALGPPKRRKRK